MRSVSPGTTGRRNRAFSMATSSTSLFCAVRHALQHQDAGGLRHGLHDQHAGHHRKIGKVALEKRLVVGDILDPDDAFGFHFYDAVHQQKRVAMRQNRPDIVDIQNGHGSAYYRTATVCYRREVRGKLPVLLLGALTVLFLVGLFSGEIFDPDFWWHLKTGQYIVEQHRLPVPDPFSYTTAGAQPGYPGEEQTRYFNLTHEWLAQVLLYFVYRLGGFPGVVLLRALMVAAACLIAGALAARRSKSFTWGVAAALAAASVAVTFATDRPGVAELSVRHDLSGGDGDPPRNLVPARCFR